jgi:glycosyltransferase involved in cell wall biosynthesis
MHIAQIAPLTEAIPPRLYGGTERVVSWLTEELVALGHDVTLFASGDSRTSAKLEPVWPKALRLDGSVCDANALHMTMLERVCRKAQEFDVLHLHDAVAIPFTTFVDVPTVSTLMLDVSASPGASTIGRVTGNEGSYLLPCVRLSNPVFDAFAARQPGRLRTEPWRPLLGEGEIAMTLTDPTT